MKNDKMDAPPPQQTEAPSGAPGQDAFLARLVEDLTAGVFRSTPEPPGRCLYANAAMVRMFGYSDREEFLAVPVTAHYVDPADRHRLLERIARDGKVENFPLAQRRRDGTVFWASLTERICRDAGGRVVCLEGVLTDITEHRRTEEALCRSEQRYRAIVESAGEVIVTISHDGTYLVVNSVAARRLGLRPEELVGRNMRDVFPPEIAERQLANIRRVIETGRAATFEEWTEVRGEPKWYVTTVRPLPAPDGRPEAALVLARDATAAKRAEQQLRRAHVQLLAAREAERRRVAAELHDSVGQALAALKLTLQNAASAQPEPPGGTVPAILRDLAGRCGEIIREVRRICHGLYPPVLESLGPVAAIAQLVDRCDAPDLEVSMDCPAALEGARFAPEVEVAAFRIAQEALANALRHSRAGKVRVSLATDGDRLVLRVADDGVGFDADDPASEGMGLSSMAQRAGAVGGSLTIRSAPGETVIEARLPHRPA